MLTTILFLKPGILLHAISRISPDLWGGEGQGPKFVGRGEGKDKGGNERHHHGSLRGRSLSSPHVLACTDGLPAGPTFLLAPTARRQPAASSQPLPSLDRSTGRLPASAFTNISMIFCFSVLGVEV